MPDLADPTLRSLDTARLRELLEHSPAGLSESTIAEAISVGPDAAGDVATALLDAARRNGRGRAAAIQAAWLVRELRLERSVPALTRCIEEPADGVLRDAAMVALAALGPAGIESLIAAFERASRPDTRGRVAEALARVHADDDRIRAALMRVVPEDAGVAILLARRGDWRAVPGLLQTFDRLSHEPDPECLLCRGLELSAIASAVRALGGLLSPAQLDTLSDVLDRGESLWTDVPDAPDAHAAPPAPRTRSERPGRNDPCPCGSGKKYKRCHLDEDLRRGPAGAH